MARRVLGLVLILCLVAAGPAAEGRDAEGRGAGGSHYAGWAVEAYPEDPAAEMQATVQRLVDHGADVIWIGHNNPGEVDAAKVEPGLSYAVYEAYVDPSDPRHADAVAMIEAQRRMLAACRAAGVPAALPTLRRLMTAPASSPRVLVLAPPARAYEAIGAGQASVLLEVHPLQRLAMLAKAGVNAAVVGSLVDWGPSPLGLGRLVDGVQVIVALAPTPGVLAEGDLVLLREFLAQGGRVVTSPGVAEVLADVAEAEPALLYGGLVARRGALYAAQQGIAVLFEDARHEVLADFWREVLGVAEVQPGYHIVTADYAFHYHLGPAAPVRLALPFAAYGCRYDEQARPVERFVGSRLDVTLDRREYLFLRRDRRAWPWPA